MPARDKSKWVKFCLLFLLFSIFCIVNVSASEPKRSSELSSECKRYKITEKQAKEIENLQIEVPDFSDTEKTLVIYDYVTSTVSYKKEESTIYDALVKRESSCMGICAAISYLLDREGISSVILISKEANHAWNAVYLDGRWYHLDATFGSPTNSPAGYVDHDWFLLSTKDLLEKEPERADMYVKLKNGDVRWDRKISDTKTGFWNKTKSSTYYYGGKWYYTDYDSLRIMERSADGSEKSIYSLKMVWTWLQAGTFWESFMFSGFEDALYFNLPDGIYKLNLTTKAISGYTSFQELPLGIAKVENNKLIVDTGEDILHTTRVFTKGDDYFLVRKSVSTIKQ